MVNNIDLMACASEEILRELDHGCKIVQLTLFRHQVSGHHVFFMYDDKKILKQLNEHEHKAYENFPEDLKSFIPKYYGMLYFDYDFCP